MRFDISLLGPQTPAALLTAALYVSALLVVARLAYPIIVKRKRSFGGIAVSSTATPPTRKSEIDYSSVFPPSCRQQLCEIIPSAPLDNQPHRLKGPSLLKSHENFRVADAEKLVFTNVSVGEVRQLGDFPDYAKLSGVPLPAPLPNFDIDTAVPRPFRPLRWAYHQTMSFKKMEPDCWLELDRDYRERIAQRKELYRQHGSDVLASMPGSELACKELMEMALQFLCARYPHYFELRGHTLINNILGKSFDLNELDPLIVLLNNVPEDFAMALRDDKTGRYHCQAGVICSSVGWNLGQKVGQNLTQIHHRVPDYKEKMDFSMERFFSKLPTDAPIQRGSWGLESGTPLYLPESHPDYVHRETQSPDLKVEDIHLRVDWQTLRRLPLSGAVVFNFKALFTPITEFRDEPYIPSLTLKILNEAKKSLLEYKGTWHVEHVAKPVLAEYERFQIEQGMIEPDWEPQTLEENPFYPGWQKKWQSQ